MTAMTAWLKSVLIAILGMLGGQKFKSARRIGIPAIALTAGKRALPMVLLFPLLSVGYGQDSILMRWLGSDTLVRLIYALMLSLPFLFYGIKRWGISALLLGIAFQVHAGRLGQVWGMDVLAEDILRYGMLGILISFNLFL